MRSELLGPETRSSRSSRSGRRNKTGRSSTLLFIYLLIYGPKCEIKNECLEALDPNETKRKRLPLRLGWKNHNCEEPPPENWINIFNKPGGDKVNSRATANYFQIIMAIKQNSFHISSNATHRWCSAERPWTSWAPCSPGTRRCRYPWPAAPSHAASTPVSPLIQSPVTGHNISLNTTVCSLQISIQFNACQSRRNNYSLSRQQFARLQICVSMQSGLSFFHGN